MFNNFPPCCAVQLVPCTDDVMVFFVGLNDRYKQRAFIQCVNFVKILNIDGENKY